MTLAVVAKITTAGACRVAARGQATEGRLPPAIAAIVSKPVYAHSTWQLFVVDLATGSVLLDQGSEKMSVTGSILKVYAAGAALDVY